uniref:Uncharacterized protein n=1 Tax=viral metagenome TaxID=1070528 RepID=A0A6C0HM28_9ZZZZ
MLCYLNIFLVMLMLYTKFYNEYILIPSNFILLDKSKKIIIGIMLNTLAKKLT